MYVSFKTKLEWKKKMQRELRKKGFGLAYKQDKESFNVYLNTERNGNSIFVSYDFSKTIPVLSFDIPSSRNKETHISSRKREVIDYVLHEVRQLKTDDKNDLFQIHLRLANWKWSEEDKETARTLMEEHGYAKELEDNFTDYISKEALPLLKQFRETNGHIEAKFRNDYWNKDNSLLYFGAYGQFPILVKYNFEEVIDREVTVTANYKEMNFKLSFKSPHHKKELIKDEFLFEDFLVEYQQFIDEEKFKELFSEPKMNSKIENRLQYLKNELYPRPETNEIFKALLTYYAVEELTDLCNERNTNIKRISNTSFEDRISTKEKDVRKVYNMQIFTLFDKYIAYEHEDIRINSDEEEKEEKNKYFTLYKTFEEAEKEQKKWLFEKITK